MASTIPYTRAHRKAVREAYRVATDNLCKAMRDGLKAAKADTTIKVGNLRRCADVYERQHRSLKALTRRDEICAVSVGENKVVIRLYKSGTIRVEELEVSSQGMAFLFALSPHGSNTFHHHISWGTSINLGWRGSRLDLDISVDGESRTISLSQDEAQEASDALNAAWQAAR